MRRPFLTSIRALIRAPIPTLILTSIRARPRVCRGEAEVHHAPLAEPPVGDAVAE
ncbi:hypothetical protein ACFRFC_31560 [Streptomyces sp. NPDC056734]|uniref:hypothetical protein n=1 Tax=Streptomyces sp. NPDC056734 TaxID=3345931 RepID=UPI0036955546